MFADSTHPKRVDKPEALGLRHIALLVDSIDEVIKNLNVEAEPVRESNGQYYTFVRDPDNLPIEIREKIKK